MGYRYTAAGNIMSMKLLTVVVVFGAFINEQCQANVSASGMSCIKNCMRECRPRSSSTRQVIQDILHEVEDFETTEDAPKVEISDKELKDGDGSDNYDKKQAQAKEEGGKIGKETTDLGRELKDVFGKEPESEDVGKKEKLKEIMIKDLKKKIEDMIIAETQTHNDVMAGDRVEVIYEKGRKQAFTCAYSCTAGGGCKVDYLGPFRSEAISGTGTCFPKANGGFCVGTPRECQDCNQAIVC